MEKTPGTAEKTEIYFSPFAGASFYSYNGLIKEITDTPITLKEFNGGHFFIFDHSKAICDSIVHRLKQKNRS